MNDKWMTCGACKAIVQLNATGICLGCQLGFDGQHEEDKYIPIETKLQSKEEEISRLKDREKELEDALDDSVDKPSKRDKKNVSRRRKKSS